MAGYWGVAGFAAVLLLCGLRVPIAIAMGTVGAVGSVALMGWAPSSFLMSNLAFEAVFPYGLSVIPLFVFMGVFASYSGLSQNLYSGINAFVGHRRGGLAAATVGACAVFGAICGSSLATCATLGRVALPEMDKRGYSPAFAGATVAGNDRADAGRCAGENQVSRLQAIEARDMGNNVVDWPDQFGQVGVLFDDTVDRQGDPSRAGIEAASPGRFLADQPASRRRLLDILAGIPWPPEITGLELQVAAGHIEPDGITPYRPLRLPRLYLESRLPHGHDQFDLEMEVMGFGRIGDAAGIGRVGVDDRLGPFGEEERGFAIGIAPHLAGMGFIIASDAEYAAHGITVAGLGLQQRRTDGLEQNRHLHARCSRQSPSFSMQTRSE